MLLLIICCSLLLISKQVVKGAVWSSVSPVPYSELHALLELKSHLANSASSQALFQPWNITNSHTVCNNSSWTGVTCTVDISGQSHIAAINLTASGLAGSLPPHLGNLTFMLTLDLSSNLLMGGIPKELSTCSSLQVLDLYNNSLIGPIPASLASLSNLQVLRLCDNSLSGQIPPPLFTNCTSLRKISLCHNALIGSIPSLNICSTQSHLPAAARLQKFLLSENNLTGAIPRSLGICTSLVRVELSANDLSGDIPSELGFLAQLENLRLQGNRLVGPIPSSLGACTNLLELALYENQLTGSIPRELGALTNLSIGLWLHQNYLTGAIPPSLGNCTRLVTLVLANNELSGSIPTELGQLVQLQSLIIWQNKLSGMIPRSLGNCTGLISLQLSHNRLSGSIPAAIINLQHLQFLGLDDNDLLGFNLPTSFSNSSSLISLSIAHNQVNGSIPQELAQLYSLQDLNLSCNQLSGNIPWGFLSNCSSLYHLDLSHNQLAGSLSSELGRLPKLRSLKLQHNLLQGTIPDLGGLSLQESFDLSSNQLNGTLPDSLANVLTRVATLRFSDNDLSGSLPLWLGQLLMVQEIDLSHNHLVGTIPESLGDCVALTHLNLSRNSLVGELPLHLINSSSLQSLDVSMNKLTGFLPPSLEHLQSLQFLNISFNNFNGPIPCFGIFEHLNASCFQGNPGLCGPVIQKLCTPHHQAHFTDWRKGILIALVTSVVMIATIVLAIIYKGYRHLKNQFAEVSQHFDNLAEVRHFSAKGLWESTHGYAKENLLGEGAMSVVYKGVLSNGEAVAVKKFRDNIAITSREALLQEMNILGKLRHRNLVKVLGCVMNFEIQAMVLEFMPNGSLEQYLCHAGNEGIQKRLSWPMVLKVSQGIANALMYLHHEYGSLPIIHGDVKPGNILLDFELEAHLADFGLAKLAKSTAGGASLSSTFKGSIGYMAPEFAYASKITTKVDIYSFGVVVLEMLTGIGPTHELLHGVTLHEWVKQRLLLSHNSFNLREIVNAPLLQSSCLRSQIDEHPIQLLLQMAIACTEELPKKRPPMQHIMEILKSLVA